MAKIQNPTKVITGVNTRWSYANVWDAKSINGGAPKYSVSLIIPKSDTVTVNKIKAAIEAAYEEGQSKLKGNGKTVPTLSILKTPLRDGDLERPDDPAYANAWPALYIWIITDHFYGVFTHFTVFSIDNLSGHRYCISIIRLHCHRNRIIPSR